MAGSQSLKDTTYARILEDILNYEYKPNQIITEKELVLKYGCSKSPVREALISLCNDGVLRSIPRCGYEVIRLTLDDVTQLQDYRRVLECGILQSCYKKITPRQLDKLRELDQKCTASQNMWEHWEDNTAFHLHLMFCSQNQYAFNQLKHAMTVLRRAYAQLYWDRWNSLEPPTDTRFHQKILASLAAGDVTQAVQALDDDLNDFGEVKN